MTNNNLRIGFLLVLALALAVMLVFSSCGNDRHWDTDAPDNICGQEPCYEGPYEAPWVSAYHVGLEYLSPDDTSWTHDNRVLTSQNFLILSDASSDQAKIRMKNTAEAALIMIKEWFRIDSLDLGIVDLESKIQIYSACWENKGGPRAGRRGFVVYAYDSQIYLNSEWTQVHQTDTVEHECTHVVQFKLGGLFSRVWAWFTEGLAETVSGGVLTPISCWPEVVEWRQDPDHVNPISIQRLEQIPENVWGQHYPLFALAFRYLLDPRGQNRTIEDLKAMFADIGHGMGFEEAFELHMGLTLAHYESNFWAWMQAYLPPTCDGATRIDWNEPEWMREFEEPGSKF